MYTCPTIYISKTNPEIEAQQAGIFETRQILGFGAASSLRTSSFVKS